MMELYKKPKTTVAETDDFRIDPIRAEDATIDIMSRAELGAKNMVSIPRLPLSGNPENTNNNQQLTPTSSCSSLSPKPRRNDSPSRTPPMQSCSFLSEAGQGGATSSGIALEWLRNESPSARGFQPAPLHGSYLNNHLDPWSSKDPKDLSPKGARLDELSTDASSNLFTPRTVPGIETMKQWTVDDMHTVLSTLLEENRTLQTQLQKSQNLQEQYEVALSQARDQLHPIDGLVEQVERIDMQLQRQSKGVMSNDDLKALRVFARSQESKKKTEAARTTCGADACKFM